MTLTAAIKLAAACLLLAGASLMLGLVRALLVDDDGVEDEPCCK